MRNHYFITSHKSSESFNEIFDMGLHLIGCYHVKPISFIICHSFFHTHTHTHRDNPQPQTSLYLCLFYICLITIITEAWKSCNSNNIIVIIIIIENDISGERKLITTVYINLVSLTPSFMPHTFLYPTNK